MAMTPPLINHWDHLLGPEKKKPAPLEDAKPTPLEDTILLEIAAVAALQGLITSTRGNLSPETVANLAWDYTEALVKRGRERGLIHG